MRSLLVLLGVLAGGCAGTPMKLNLTCNGKVLIEADITPGVTTVLTTAAIPGEASQIACRAEVRERKD